MVPAPPSSQESPAVWLPHFSYVPGGGGHWLPVWIVIQKGRNLRASASPHWLLLGWSGRLIYLSAERRVIRRNPLECLELLSYNVRT